MLPAYLPEKYVGSKEQKVQVYRKIANITGVHDAEDLEKELQDRFGPVPEATRQLIEISLLRALAHEAGVASVTVRQGQARMKFALQAEVDPLQIMQAAERFGQGAHFTKGETPAAVEAAPGLCRGNDRADDGIFQGSDPGKLRLKPDSECGIITKICLTTELCTREDGRR